MVIGAATCGLYLLLANTARHDIVWGAVGLALVVCILIGVRCIVASALGCPRITSTRRHSRERTPVDVVHHPLR